MEFSRWLLDWPEDERPGKPVSEAVVFLGAGVRGFVVDTLPRQVYLHSLLRLPALSFSRVARIFEDAEVSKHEIQRMIDNNRDCVDRFRSPDAGPTGQR